MRSGRFARHGFVRHLALGAFLALAATTASGRSHACGGCFHEPEPTQPEQETKTTVVVAHRMALSISPTQSVLWDQVQYSGSPDAFAWVLPVKPGAYLELSNDAWLETLDAATSTHVLSPDVMCSYPDSGDYDYGYSSGCSRGGCVKEEAGGFGGGDSYGGAGGGGGGEPEPPPVVVVHQASVGPYETVTLHANVPNALSTWLTDHGFVIDPNVQPIVDAYTSEGFDFIAMRLLPGQGIDRMKPVRVVMPGASPTLPLRMVAAGTGANVAITLYVISEGRYRAENFPNGEVDPDQITWDFDTSDSNYAQLRSGVLAQLGGRTWNTAYARQDTLLSPRENAVSGVGETFVVGSSGSYDTIAEAYVRQAIANGEGTSDACVTQLRAVGPSLNKVVAACDPNPDAGASDAGSGGASPVPACENGQIDGRTLACGTIDDVAVALVGLHPNGIWLTRLEANLPRAALADDLTLGAAGVNEVSNWIVAADYLGDPCAALGGTPLSEKRPIGDLGRGPGKAMIARGGTPPLVAALTFGAVAAMVVRRYGRGRKRGPRAPSC